MCPNVNVYAINSYLITIIGEMVGFVDLGNVNNELMQLTEQCTTRPNLATHVCAFMIRGIFTNLLFPLAHYPSNGVTAEQLYSIVWELIAALEGAGLKVRCMHCYYTKAYTILYT